MNILQNGNILSSSHVVDQKVNTRNSKIL